MSDAARAALRAIATDAGKRRRQPDASHTSTRVSIDIPAPHSTPAVHDHVIDEEEDEEEEF